MKILNRYILKEHIAPFLFAVFVITFILVLETIPKIVDLVINKNISFLIVLELIFFNLAWMIALSVPMAVLVANLLTFGRMTSDSEIIAIKASGINLVRIMVPLFVAAGILTFLMIQFSDKILPDLNHRARVLTGDIRAMRPTLLFRSGVFITDIAGYIILIDRINHETSQIWGIRINETRDATNPRIIVADSGLMKFIDNGQTIQLTLYDGEVHILNTKNVEDYQRLDFKEQVINIGGVGSELERSESSYRSDREMNIAQMRQKVESARDATEPFLERMDNTITSRISELFSDSLAAGADTAHALSDRLALLDIETLGIQRKLDREASQIKSQQNMINKFKIEIYKKYAIPAASFAFVLIGTPLGILSRRGGMGITASVSLVIFTFYWAFLIGGEDLSDRGLISPFWGMWTANIVLGVVGIYLLVKVITEKPLFSFFRK